MKKSILIGMASLLTVSSTWASTNDIRGRGDKYIKVTELHNGEFVSFELCSLKRKNTCFQIGSRKMYSKAELQKLRRSEGKDVVLSILADVGIGVIAIYGGALAGAVIVSAGGGAAMVGASGGAVLGTAGTAALGINVDALNPAEQYRQVKVISDDVINDKDVVMERNVDDIAHTLRAVLSNLD